jgi:uncharacterized NAD(P)/FAD-binding protein YdhS
LKPSVSAAGNLQKSGRLKKVKKITIIGGGAAGTLLAVNLIKNAGDAPLEINLIEKRERVGRGVAYSATADYHLLNVPAAKMGAFPDDVEHFYRWLTAKSCDYAPTDFVPRRLYGEYLRELFDETSARRGENVAVRTIEDEAADVSLRDGKAFTRLASGAFVESDKVVLAFGNFLPPHPKAENQAFIETDKYFQNPWRADLLEKLSATDDILIIGTGLTFADVAMSLHHNGHAGKIRAYSTRGLLPAVHKLGFVYDSFADELKGQTRITDLLKIVRRHIKKAELNGSDWRAVIDSLRPQTQAIWLNLPHAEKRYFKQHLSRYWNVARHRLPPETARTLDEMQAANQLEIGSGRLRKIEADADGKYAVTFATNGVENTFSVDAIINCIGSEGDFKRIESPLIQTLLGKELINTDNLKMGLDAAPDGSTIDKNGAASEVIFTLGTALKGVLWESTAMPEIRAQAGKLAEFLLSDSIRYDARSSAI